VRIRVKLENKKEEKDYTTLKKIINLQSKQFGLESG
jgi:hypothetical protein